MAACPLRNLDRLDSDKLRLQLGLAVLEEHGDDLLEVASQLIQTLTLAMRAGPAWDVAHIEARLRPISSIKC